MVKSMESIAGFLKGLIDKHGPGYLAEEPLRVYGDLTAFGADRKICAGLLYVTLLGITAEAKECREPEELSARIRQKCSLNKGASDRLAGILCALYSAENEKSWVGLELAGLREFMEEDFEFDWEGLAVWTDGCGTVDCYYDASIVLTPTEKLSRDEELSRLLKKNPYITKDEIRNYFEIRLQVYLDKDFERYCTADDYYQPVAEDYRSNLECELSSWCERVGFELVLCDGDGGESDYEPNYHFRRF